MRLPAALAPHAHRPGIRQYARAFRVVERELTRLGGTVHAADIFAKQDTRSWLGRLLALEKATDADHSVIIEGEAGGRPVRVTLPFRRGLHLPYTLELRLRHKVEFVGVNKRVLLSGTRWHAVPALPAVQGRVAELQALRLPPGHWRHESGGIPVLLWDLGRLAPSAESRQWPSVWTVYSAYQGWVFNVGPRVAKYVEAASRLEALLARWAQAPEGGEPPQHAA